MSDDGRSEAVLEACLERMRSEDLAVDAIVAPYPDMAEGLRPLLDLAAELDGLGAAPLPGDAFRLELAGKLAAAPLPAAMRSRTEGLPTDAVVRALDACLERIRVEGVAAAVAMADFPELASELRPLLLVSDDLVPAEGLSEGPTAAFRSRLAAALAMAPPPRSLGREPLPGSSWLIRLWRNTALSAATAATVVLLLVSSAIYASASSRPGDWLYPLKRATEQARIWWATDLEAIAMHLANADRRLGEAVAVRSHAGEMLADFSREVTAALAEGDDALAGGTPRERVTDPLLAWLLDARGRLVDGRLELPPTAWRGALAMVDEAIRALNSEELSAAPVPRLADPRPLLHAVSPVSRQPSVAIERRLRRAGPADGAYDAPGDVGSARGERLVYVVASDRATGARSATAPPSATPVGADPGRSALDPVQPRSTPRGSQRATATASPTANSAASPTSKATEPLEPSVEPSATPGPTEVPPTATEVPPTATGIPVSPTIPVFNKPPVIDQVFCEEQRLLLGKSTMCHVVAYDPEGEDLSYFWTADVQQMLNERQKDATYYAAWGVGSGVMVVRIAVYVSDAGQASPSGDGAVSGETFVEVHPPDVQGR